jgi:hypothetical protein
MLEAGIGGRRSNDIMAERSYRPEQLMEAYWRNAPFSLDNPESKNNADNFRIFYFEKTTD